MYSEQKLFTGKRIRWTLKLKLWQIHRLVSKIESYLLRQVAFWLSSVNFHFGLTLLVVSISYLMSMHPTGIQIWSSKRFKKISQYILSQTVSWAWQKLCTKSPHPFSPKKYGQIIQLNSSPVEFIKRHENFPNKIKSLFFHSAIKNLF